MIKVDLLIIDPQNDFCSPNGSLFVNGADKDMERLSTFIQQHKDKINDIHVTLDQHHVVDVAHPSFWRDLDGNMPAPLTTISYNDVVNGKWLTSIPQMKKWAVDYTKALQDGGRYPLSIWPEHCIIGSEGACIYPNLSKVLYDWERETPAMFTKVTKGSNFKTEHYSAVKAEVVDPEDISTQVNTSFIDKLGNPDIHKILVAGEALNFCVANTLRDIISEFGIDNAKKLVILEDATSSVLGNDFLEKLQDDFISEMKSLGVEFSTTVDYFK